MKIIVAEFKQETNSFSKVKCGLERFKQNYYAYGDELYKELELESTEMGGALSVLKNENVEIIPSISMQSNSGGCVTFEAYNHFKKIFFRDIDLNQPVDGIYLSLHGATSIEDVEDGMGMLIRETREKAGIDVVISVSFDYHANITKQMIENVDIVRGFQTYPHIDLFETGRDAARLLVKTIQGVVKPAMVAYKIPMINQAEGSPTTEGSMAELSKMARTAEKEQSILSVSYFQMQPWLDVADAGCAIVVIADKDYEVAKNYGKKFATFLWDNKDKFKVKLKEFSEILHIAKSTSNVIVFSDSADAPSAGATGDSTFVLKKYLSSKTDLKTYMTIVDPETVQKAIITGIGNSSEFYIGGKIHTELFSPAKIFGTVTRLSDGSFEMDGESSKGKTFTMGASAVIKVRNLYILVMTIPVPVFDSGPYLSVGLNPAMAKLVMVKSPTQFKSTYIKYTNKLYQINTPGASSSYIWKMPFKNINRPMYPFDNIESFSPVLLTTGFGGKGV